MLLHALLLPLALAPLPVQGFPIEGSDEHHHGDDFASMLEHRAFPDLARWKERHPWRVGTEIRKFVLRLEEERSKGDPEVDRVWNTHAAFLAEALVDDVYTVWLITMLNYDIDARATFATVRAGLADVAASVRTRKDLSDEAILAEVDGLRAPIAPAWCFESCVEELLAIAEAAAAAGRAKAADALTREVQELAARTRDGEVALRCAASLLRTEHEAGRTKEAEQEVDRFLAAARGVARTPPDFEATLATIVEWFGADSPVAVGVDTVRAELAEDAGRQEEALALWRGALDRARRLRDVPLPTDPSLEETERWLRGPDPARRGALLAARMGRFDDAWKLARVAASPPGTLDEADEEARRKETFAARRLDALLVLVVDRQESLAAWSDADGIRTAILPTGLGRLRELVTELRSVTAGAGNGGGIPPLSQFDPGPARRLFQSLLEPLGKPLRGRIGVQATRELADVPLGMLVVGETGKDPSRPRFLVEDATIVRTTRGRGAWEIDAGTAAAVKQRLQELAGAEDAVRTVQIEMIEGRGALGSERKHPVCWAGLELEPR